MEPEITQGFIARPGACTALPSPLPRLSTENKEWPELDLLRCLFNLPETGPMAEKSRDDTDFHHFMPSLALAARVI